MTNRKNTHKSMASVSQDGENRDLQGKPSDGEGMESKKLNSDSPVIKEDGGGSQRRGRSGLKVFWLGFFLALLAVLAAAALGGWAVWKGPLKTYAVGDDVQTRLTRQEEDLKHLQNQIEQQTKTPQTQNFAEISDSLEVLKKDVLALQDRFHALDQTLAQADQGGNMVPETLAIAVTDLTHRLSKLEEQAMKTPDDGTSLASNVTSPVFEEEFSRLRQEVRDRLDEETRRLDTLEGEFNRIVKDEQRLEDFAQNIDFTQRLAAFMILRDSVHSGQPFSLALERFIKTYPQADVTSLTPYADTGIMQPMILARHFPEQALRDAVRRYSKTHGQKTGMLGRLKDFVNLHSRDGSGRNTPQNIITRTRLALQTGNVEEALQLMKALPPDILKESGAWYDKAQAYEESQKNLNTFFQHPDFAAPQSREISP